MRRDGREMLTLLAVKFIDQEIHNSGQIGIITGA